MGDIINGALEKVNTQIRLNTTKRPENPLQVFTDTYVTSKCSFQKNVLKSGMQRLYGSLCRISLTDHPVLAYVGAWTLLESLANYIGKDSTTEFAAFYNMKINEFTKNKTERGQYKVPIQDIHSKGNITKHSGTYDVMEARQLVADFQSIEKFLIYCAGEAVNISS